MFFKLNCGYHPHVSYKKDVNSHFQLKLVDELVNKLRDLITICDFNL